MPCRGDRRQARSSRQLGAGDRRRRRLHDDLHGDLDRGTNALGVVYYVFNDGELAQIGQAQAIPYGRKPCTQIGKLNIEGVALATGAAYLPMSDNP